MAQPFVPGENVAEVNLHFIQQNKPAQNGFYVENAAGWDALSLTDLGQTVVSWWTTNMAPLLTTSIGLLNVGLRDLTTQNSAVAIVTPIITPFGAVAEEPCPNNVAWVVKFTTNRAGRSFRGRNYIGCFTRLMVDNDLVPSSFAEDVVEAYNTLVTTLTGDGYDIGVFSRKANGVWRTNGVFTPWADVGYTDLGVDTQRGRLK